MRRPSPRGRTLSWFRWLALVALAGYAVFLTHHGAIVAGGSDSSGYLNSARLFAQGRLLGELRVPPEFGPRESLDPVHFVPPGFSPDRDVRRLTPTYPTGLPLHFALAAKLLGWHAGPLLIVLLAAIGAIGLCYLVARELGLEAPLAAAGAIVLAAFPVFIFTSIQPLSDTLATAWTLGAMFAALRARHAFAWAAAGGAAFAIAVLVRPSNLVLAPALLVLVGMHWRKLGLFVLGGLPGAAWMAFYNHELYGGALRSGYGNVFGAFALSHGAPTALYFARWLALLLPAALLLLPAAALVHPATRRRELLALALAFGAVAGLYAFYAVSREVWWCLRFILPAVPALILAGLLGVEALARRVESGAARRFRRVAAAVLALWAVGNAAYWTPRLGIDLVKGFEEAYADGSLAARHQLPENAVVVSLAFSGSLYYYTGYAILRWDQMEAAAFKRYAALAQNAGRPVCAVLFEFEEEDAFRRCPGEWTRLATLGNVGLWQLAAPKS